MLMKKRLETAKTSTASVIPIRTFDRQLEDLYARRSAIETLIESLEDYQRFRAVSIDTGSRKTA